MPGIALFLTEAARHSIFYRRTVFPLPQPIISPPGRSWELLLHLDLRLDLPSASHLLLFLLLKFDEIVCLILRLEGPTDRMLMKKTLQGNCKSHQSPPIIRFNRSRVAICSYIFMKCALSASMFSERQRFLQPRISTTFFANGFLISAFP